ncbi:MULTISPECIES: DUF952 domain-containing protein [unclassified Sphingobium]|uniref:DUF952 domain-containing protein n=1 Tax=unclassified Sphingobium TaxID=2611147 RepID=UPI0022255959|nr:MULTISPECIES: DUF952 domain-containing protein [unclassified Sphingobium]MCW2369083.1 uncharacterized protein (DUF952 family) [Sphingobium sp. B11D3D]MCW2394094.1 uncharacterized protein (DUF952 family) [Sphingobium sp. B8D3B]MCW2417608.1 uncharacterized protein (DUF952 family) [Sphingobium sp. B8D3C]
MTELFAFKLLRPEEWSAWRDSGVFAGAPVDLADGYIHLSAREQVRETAAKWFADVDPAILVMVDLPPLGDTVRWEVSRGGALFPHVYGPIPMSAVAGHSKLRLGADGKHAFPAGFEEP